MLPSVSRSSRRARRCRRPSSRTSCPSLRCRSPAKSAAPPRNPRPTSPSELEAPKGAPNVLLILTDDVGFAASSTVRRPDPDAQRSISWRRTAYATTCSTRRRCARRRARRCITGRNHHIVRDRRDHGARHRLSGLQHAAAEELRHGRRDPQAELAATRRGSARTTTSPDWQSSQAGPFDLWPTGLGLRVLLRLHRRRHGPVAPGALRGHQADRGAEHAREVSPRRRPRRPRHRLDPRSSRRWRRTSRSSPTTRRALPTRRTTRPRSGSRSSRGSSTRAGTSCARRRSRGRSKLGVVPGRTRSSRRGPRRSRAWDSLDRRPEEALRPHDGGLRRLSAPTADYQHRARRSTPIEETGELDNTLIIYIMGDNGASAEGTLQGLANEVGVAANGVAETVPYLLSIMDELGGHDCYNHYPVGWAHAMDTPFQWTKQVASHFGGTRNGLVISWPSAHQGQGRHPHASSPQSSTSCRRSSKRPAFEQPTMLDGVKQTPIEGTSPFTPSTTRSRDGTTPSANTKDDDEKDLPVFAESSSQKIIGDEVQSGRNLGPWRAVRVRAFAEQQKSTQQGGERCAGDPQAFCCTLKERGGLGAQRRARVETERSSSGAETAANGTKLSKRLRPGSNRIHKRP